MSGKQSNKIQMVVQVQRDGKSEILKEPGAIAQAFKSHNKKHFSQAKGGFFNTTSIQNVIDSHQVSEYIPPNKEQEKRIVNILRQIHVNEISSNIDLEDWKKKFKIWNERTRTSPSGVHLGHYKALLRPVMNSDDETMELNTVIQDM